MTPKARKPRTARIIHTVQESKSWGYLVSDDFIVLEPFSKLISYIFLGVIQARIIWLHDELGASSILAAEVSEETLQEENSLRLKTDCTMT